jgi:hypothetical protein
MSERRISDADVEAALTRPVGEPRSGQPGTVLVDGFAAGGRLLCVCVRDEDRRFVVTAYWR